MKGKPMNRYRSEGNGKPYKGNAHQQWVKLTDDQLNVIAKKRDQLIGKKHIEYSVAAKSKMNISKFLVTAILAGATSLAQATVFTDNFDNYPVELNWSSPAPSTWTVTNGTVDLIGFTDVASFDFLPGNGGYIDLDGSTGQAGLFSKSISLLSGTNYALTFDLAGSQRGSTEVVDVNFGGVLGNYSLNSADAFSLKTMSFTPNTSGIYTISFQNGGGDNVGALLDNVRVTAVPEPETYAMLLTGLGLMGFIARRRKD
jgi:uncharacterized protein YjbJ (UPF0337 family)